METKRIVKIGFIVCDTCGVRGGTNEGSGGWKMVAKTPTKLALKPKSRFEHSRVSAMNAKM